MRERTSVPSDHVVAAPLLAAAPPSTAAVRRQECDEDQERSLGDAQVLWNLPVGGRWPLQCRPE